VRPLLNWLKWRWILVLAALTPSCRQVARLASRRHEHPLSRNDSVGKGSTRASRAARVEGSPFSSRLRAAAGARAPRPTRGARVLPRKSAASLQLSPWDRLRLRAHLTICDACERYLRQLDILYEAAGKLGERLPDLGAEARLAAEAKERLKARLRCERAG